jgi:hypothetical protein
MTLRHNSHDADVAHQLKQRKKVIEPEVTVMVNLMGVVCCLFHACIFDGDEEFIVVIISAQQTHAIGGQMPHPDERELFAGIRMEWMRDCNYLFVI